MTATRVEPDPYVAALLEQERLQATGDGYDAGREETLAAVRETVLPLLDKLEALHAELRATISKRGCSAAESRHAASDRRRRSTVRRASATLAAARWRDG